MLDTPILEEICCTIAAELSPPGREADLITVVDKVAPDGTINTLVEFALGDAVIGAYFDPVAGLNNALVELASQLQDGFTEALRVATPACPGHPHPLQPVLDERGHPVWACPNGGYRRSILAE